MDRENREKGSIIPVIAVVVLLIAGVGIYFAKPFFISKQNEVSTSLTPTTPNSQPSGPKATPGRGPTTDSDLPPLYPEVEWKNSQEGEYIFPDSKLTAIRLDGYYVESNTPTSQGSVDEFFEYYKDFFNNKGWSLDGEAGGPDGNVYTYKKGDYYFIARSKVISESPLSYKLIITYSK